MDPHSDSIHQSKIQAWTKQQHCGQPTMLQAQVSLFSLMNSAHCIIRHDLCWCFCSFLLLQTMLTSFILFFLLQNHQLTGLMGGVFGQSGSCCGNNNNSNMSGDGDHDGKCCFRFLFYLIIIVFFSSMVQKWRTWYIGVPIVGSSQHLILVDSHWFGLCIVPSCTALVFFGLLFLIKPEQPCFFVGCNPIWYQRRGKCPITFVLCGCFVLVELRDVACSIEPSFEAASFIGI